MTLFNDDRVHRRQNVFGNNKFLKFIDNNFLEFLSLPTLNPLVPFKKCLALSLASEGSLGSLRSSGYTQMERTYE